MKLLVERFQCDDKCSLGRFYVDGQFYCYSLEPIDRHIENGGEKVFGKTAIPRGEYRVTITYSPHFKEELPLLNAVPDYEGVRIHPGNTAADTEGCITVGMGYGADQLFNSRVAFVGLMQKLEVAYAKGEEIAIEVK